ncbi:MAG TPA: hypothetical protein VFF66_07950 [Brevundimonas sp.]|nr:hypothetical protein [Brevundimonas sp.]
MKILLNDEPVDESHFRLSFTTTLKRPLAAHRYGSNHSDGGQ